MPGCGKTSVGKALAQLLGWSFIDSDAQIRTSTGVDISTIFELEGEAGFRRRETETIAQLAQVRQSIVATGGGSVLADENRDLMKAEGTVVYLRTPRSTLLRRIRKDKTRPLLRDGNLEAKLDAMLETRTPLYESVCDIRIDTENRVAHQIAQEIVGKILPIGDSTPTN